MQKPDSGRNSIHYEAVLPGKVDIIIETVGKVKKETGKKSCL